ncbi:MAG: hypothetical protein LC790_12155 [Actinobacteria bacterium]|nr:hypothetical protein [Actinomycetota bacterium]
MRIFVIVAPPLALAVLALGPVFSSRFARWEVGLADKPFDPATEAFYVTAAPVAVGLLIAIVVAADYVVRSSTRLPELRGGWALLAILPLPLLTYVLVGFSLAGSLRALMDCHETPARGRVCGDFQTLWQAEVGIAAGGLLLLVQLVLGYMRTTRALLLRAIAKLDPDKVPPGEVTLWIIARVWVSTMLEEAVLDDASRAAHATENVDDHVDGDQQVAGTNPTDEESPG